MSHTAATATGRVFVYLLVVGLCTGLSITAASAAQSPSVGPGAPSPPALQALPALQAPQAPQSPDPEDSDVDWATGWSYGGRGIVGLLRDDSLDPGFGFSGFSVLRLTTDLELEGEIGYLTMNTVADGLPQGSLSMFPLRATLRVQLWRFGGAKPYAGGGIGVYLSRFELDPSVSEELATVGFAADATVDPALGFHGGGGVEWQRGRANFGIDVKYVFSDADVMSTVVDQINGQVFRETSLLDLDGFWIAAGVRFDF